MSAGVLREVCKYSGGGIVLMLGRNGGSGKEYYHPEMGLFKLLVLSKRNCKGRMSPKFHLMRQLTLTPN